MQKPDAPFSLFGPDTLTVSRAEAAASDPGRILESEIRRWNVLHRAMGLSEFGGVPVLIVDPDQAPKDLDGFEAYMMDRLPQADHQLLTGFRFFEDELRRSLQQENLLGFVPPCAALYPTDRMGQDGIEAAIVLAPGKTCTPEQDLLYGMGAERHAPETPLLAEDNISWRYFELFHELAHVAGAREPQADHIANLFCRRAFPNSATPWVQADIRALEAVVSAAQLAAGQAEDPQHNIEVLKNYGWPMVVANDTANAMAAKDAAALTEAEILARRETVYSHDFDRLYQLGALIRTAGLGEEILSGRSDRIMRGARKLERRIAALTDDSDLRHIAGRFALAARRIHAGAPSYVNPAKPLLFTAPAR